MAIQIDRERSERHVRGGQLLSITDLNLQLSASLPAAVQADAVADPGTELHRRDQPDQREHQRTQPDRTRHRRAAVQPVELSALSKDQGRAAKERAAAAT